MIQIKIARTCILLNTMMENKNFVFTILIKFYYYFDVFPKIMSHMS